MKLIQRIHDVLEARLHPPAVVPLRPTLADRARSLFQGALKSTVLSFLKFLLWLFAATLPAVLLAAGVDAIAVDFSPHGNVTEAVCAQLDHARETILLQGYGFTSQPIADALITAHRSGVRVDVVLDASNLTAVESKGPAIEAAGIPVRYDHARAIAHNKVIVIDGAKVLTGSFNWTVAAEKHNAENLVVIDDRELAAKYAAEFQKHKAHSKARGQ